MSVRYRTIQFLRALLDKPSPVGIEFARSHLPAELQPLFRRMSPSDQAHSIRVCRALRQDGHSDPELLVAALLHDVGKCLEPLNAFERVLVVLANRMAPGQVLKWSEGQANGWRRAFIVAQKHPDWGAALVAEHGASPTTVELIRQHQRSTAERGDDAFTHRLSLLQAADSEN